MRPFALTVCAAIFAATSAMADPIEASALQSVAAETRSQVVIGCHKPNTGHSEAASGMLALATAQHAMSTTTVSANAMLRVVNPLVRATIKQSELLLPLNGHAHQRHSMSCGASSASPGWS